MIKDIIDKNQSILPNQKELAILKEHFPSCFNRDGSFDMVRFSEFLKDNVDITHEGYELKFLGKTYSKMLTSIDTETVIVPDEEHNSKPENINSENVYISGDNMDGLKHLLKSYSGQVKCIYIDPPYNTGTDGFVYNDKFNFTVPELVSKLSIDETQAERILELTKRGSASHSAWLMFMYPRLLMAKDLLSNDGVIFISIDDNEQSNLKLLCDDVFGEENFIANITVQTNKGGQDYLELAKTHEYLICYVSNVDIKLNKLDKDFSENIRKCDILGEYELRELRNRNPKFNKANRPNLFYPIYVCEGITDKYDCNEVSLQKTDKHVIEVYPYNSVGQSSCWRWGKEKLNSNLVEEKIDISNVVARKKNDGKYNIYEKYRGTQSKAKTIWNDFEVDLIWDETEMRTELGTKELKKLLCGEYFDFPKPVELVERAFLIGSKPGDLVVDFFSGSGTSFETILKLNINSSDQRRIIAIQLPLDLDKKIKTTPVSEKAKIEKTIDFLDSVNRPHTLDQIGIERIIRAAKKIKEENPETTADFGFKHYTLNEVNEDTLDKLQDFDPTSMFTDKTIYDTFGTNTILTTWLVHDGYGFNHNAKPINLNGYTAYWCDKHLYLIEPDFGEETIRALVEKYNSEGEFNPQNVAVFGYSFNFVNMESLKTNLKILKDSEKNLKINIDIRY